MPRSASVEGEFLTRLLADIPHYVALNEIVKRHFASVNTYAVAEPTNFQATFFMAFERGTA